MCVIVYIYREREPVVCNFLCVYIYIYVLYTYMHTWEHGRIFLYSYVMLH